MINNVESHALSLFRKTRKQRRRGGVHSRAYQWPASKRLANS